MSGRNGLAWPKEMQWPPARSPLRQPARPAETQHQARFAHPSLAGDAHDLLPAGLDLTEPLTQRGEFPLPTNQGVSPRSTATSKRVRRLRGRSTKGAHRGTSLHRHLAQITRFEEASGCCVSPH